MAARKKTATRKTAATGAAKKKTAPRKAATTPKRVTAIKEKSSRVVVLRELAERTDLSRKQVAAVLDELGVLIGRHVKKQAVGEFTLAGLLKIKVVNKPRRPARKGVPNPFRPGETMDVAAKPASRQVKILPLKKLKEMAG